MSNKKKLVPRRRFKEFQNADAWEQRKLDDFAIKAVDNRGKTPPLDVNGVHPLIEVSSLGQGRPNYNKVEKYLNHYSFNNHLRDYLEENDILFSTVGRIGLVSLMDENKNAVIAQNIVAFRAKERYYSHFLYVLFSNDRNVAKAKRIVMGAVQPSIKVTQLINVEYLLPISKAEQIRISEIFHSLDDLITLHQRKLDRYKELKSAYLSEMFPAEGERKPKRRFLGFTDDWEQRKLRDITFRVVRKNKDLESILPLTISAVHGLVHQEMYFNKRIASRDVSNYYLLKRGEFAYNKSYSEGFPFGAVKRLDRYDLGVLSTLYIVFALFDELVNSNYLMYYFDTTKWHKQVAERAAEGARNHGLLNISADDFFDIYIDLPVELNEQVEIGNLLNKLENLITLHQRKLEKMKNLKKAYLNEMFPEMERE